MESYVLCLCVEIQRLHEAADRRPVVGEQQKNNRGPVFCMFCPSDGEQHYVYCACDHLGFITFMRLTRGRDMGGGETNLLIIKTIKFAHF